MRENNVISFVAFWDSINYYLKIQFLKSSVIMTLVVKLKKKKCENSKALKENLKGKDLLIRSNACILSFGTDYRNDFYSFRASSFEEYNIK